MQKKRLVLLDALKTISPTPTINTLLEISSALPSIIDRSPRDNLFYVYPYLSTYFDYKKVILDFMANKNVDKNTKINRSKILQFLAFCDGYPSWENMKYHLSQSKKSIVTFSFQHNIQSSQLNVFTFYDDDKHSNHGAQLKTPRIKFPEYDTRNLWGRVTPQHHLHLLIAQLLSIINPIALDEETEEQYVRILYRYFRDIEQIHTELLITELDILQLIDFELNKPCPPDRIMSEEEKQIREKGLKQAFAEFIEHYAKKPI